MLFHHFFLFFFFNDTATTEIYTLSLHDALPISVPSHRLEFLREGEQSLVIESGAQLACGAKDIGFDDRSEEHTSELQSRLHLVCRLLLEKKKKKLTVTEVEKYTISRHKTQMIKD